MIKAIKTKAKIIVLVMLSSVLLSACNGSLEQAAEALEIMAENVEQVKEAAGATEDGTAETSEEKTQDVTEESVPQPDVKEEEQQPE